MKFLIAGLGSIGRRHLANLLALGESDIVLYRSFRSTLPNEELAAFPVERQLDSALSHKPDAVIVANPTSLHLDIAIPAAEAGCHLFLEKPVSHSFERVPELITAIKRGGGTVFVGYQFRFHPGLQRVKQLLEAEVIGKPVSAHAHWGEYLPDWHPWEDYRQSYSARADLGGGVVLTLSHPLDYLRWMLGDIEAIWAFTGTFSDLLLNVEDSAEIGLRFSSGVLASLHLDYIQRPPSHRLEIIGTQGTLIWDNLDGVTRLFKPTLKNWRDFEPPEGFNRDKLFLAQMSHFLEVVRGEVQPACSLEDGLQALRLCLAVIHSQNQGELVRSPLYEKLL